MKLVIFIVVLPQDFLVRFRRCTERNGQGVVNFSHELRFELSSLSRIGAESKTVFTELGSEDRTQSTGCRGRVGFRVELLRDHAVFLCSSASSLKEDAPSRLTAMSHCPPSFTGASLRYEMSLESRSCSVVSRMFLPYQLPSCKSPVRPTRGNSLPFQAYHKRTNNSGKAETLPS